MRFPCTGRVIGVVPSPPTNEDPVPGATNASGVFAQRLRSLVNTTLDPAAAGGVRDGNATEQKAVWKVERSGDT